VSTVAYCPLGQKLDAVITLAMRGIRVDEVKEHAWLNGTHPSSTTQAGSR
jgi:hypothetical protein